MFRRCLWGSPGFGEVGRWGFGDGQGVVAGLDGECGRGVQDGRMSRCSNRFGAQTQCYAAMAANTTLRWTSMDSQVWW
jgi:hypothetical protein